MKAPAQNTPIAEPVTESHPLDPFLPEGCRLLMLGSFPPERKRWSMEFFYPNFNNDMWRIMGLVFHGDRSYFEQSCAKRFDRDRIAAFCTGHGIGLYDTATQVRRLAGNASDKFLEVVAATDLTAMLGTLPRCTAIVTTGEKATDTLVQHFGCGKPRVGEYVPLTLGDRTLRFYRMPSSSRAYPLALDRKAACYERMFRETGILP